MNQQPAAQNPMDYTSTSESKQEKFIQEDLVCSRNNCDFSKTCLCSWCCAPCLFQRNFNRYEYIYEGKRDKDLNSKCGWCCTLQVLSFGWAHAVLPAFLRRNIRTARNIDGTPLGDYCSSAFCLPCSLIQETHELDAALKQNGIEP
ncbi:uncharacterized protein FOMMEDRAFT_26462 [Fomitiporia mediterranea MF3/22]|uniref:uncharacterized protein n=1 Tax=Fomitiporia mediterranea (strain MF3/22) TaxID=694068 RepID=UPI0004408E69|nr:uncharacterized protein FOMMEDRAFT_26462 [Fomitiporia mediterranea MF3/22]EJD05570.1 hypothetical protein FOMMEDRAFT_26462 [Fomitiporia mediterranea MF3/22]